MPFTVPTYDKLRELPSAPNQLPSVRQTAAPSADQVGGNARVPTDYVGRGMQSAGSDFEHVGLQMQAREDADLVFRAETVLKDRLRQKSEEWSKRRGVQAWNLTKDASSWWETEAVKAGEGLNDRQRIAFEQTAARMRAVSLDNLSRYEADQRRTSLDESAQANIVGSINFAAANPTNQDAIRTAREDVARGVAVRAGINGWSPERTAIETQSKMTVLHKQVLQTLVDKDPAAAEEYLKTHREEIAGADRAEVDKMVTGATRLAKAQAFADEFDPRSGATEQDAIDAARKRFKGDDERIAVAEVKSRFQEQRAARESAQKDALDKAYAEMGPTGTVARIAPSTWAKLDGEAQRKLIDQDEARIARREARAAARESRAYAAERRSLTVRERQTFEHYVDLGTRLADDPGALTVEEIASDVRSGKLTHGQGATLINAIRKNDLGSDQVNTTSLLRVLRPIVTELKYTGDQKAKAGVLQQAAEERILREQSVLKRPLKQSEMRDIVKDLVTEGTVENDFLWIDKSARKFEVLGSDRESRWKPKDTANRSAAATGPNSVPSTNTTGGRSASGRVTPAPQPQTKVINGKTYMKIGTQWFAQ